MSLSKDDWRDGITEEGKPMGRAGCLLLVLACLALDVLAVFAGWQLVTLIRDIIAG